MSKTSSLSATEFFGWKRHPFIDFPATANSEAQLIKRDAEIFERAKEFLKIGRSFALIGTPGSGKTTLVRSIAQNLDTRSYKPIWLPYAGCNRPGLLRFVADKIGIELTRKGLPPLPKLQRHLAHLQKDPGSPKPVIIVDDAQYLEPESLMDLCAMLAHPDDQGPLTTLILVGDDALERTLRLTCYKAVFTRMVCVFRMDALSPKDAKSLLEARLEVAKAPKDLFAEDAIELLTTQSRGNRRELMNLATTLCVEAHLRNERVITAELILTTTPMQAIG